VSPTCAVKRMYSGKPTCPKRCHQIHIGRGLRNPLSHDSRGEYQAKEHLFRGGTIRREEGLTLRMDVLCRGTLDPRDKPVAAGLHKALNQEKSVKPPTRLNYC